MSTYLGIDIGTSSVKTVLMDAAQSVLASATTPLTVQRPQPRWSEQDPDAWWQATEHSLDQLAVSHGRHLSAVEGIGLSGQMHGATLLDRDNKPLRHCILWNDGRSSDECAELERRCPGSREISGNLAMPGFTAPKLMWVQAHEPEVFDRVAMVLLPKDYVRLHLTGEAVSDMSDSAGTLWMDVANRRWSDDLLAATNMSAGQMPRLVEGSQAGGRLRDDLAKRWGMIKRPVVAGGGGDNAASACGVGVVRPDTAFLSLGTSGVLFVSNAGYSPNTAEAVHAFCHAVPDTWHQMGVILSATASLDWFAGLVAAAPDDLTAELSDDIGAPGHIQFSPYLSGERTPHNDAGARGNILGINHDTSRPDLTRGILQGVAFAFRDCLGALENAGARIDEVIAVGGGSRSRVWMKTIATALQLPIHVPAASDFGAAFGAARLGLLATTGDDTASVCTPPPITETIEPDPAFVTAYHDAWGQYRSIYPALKEVMAT